MNVLEWITRGRRARKAIAQLTLQAFLLDSAFSALRDELLYHKESLTRQNGPEGWQDRDA